jgi:type I restriction enzyme S subunit
MGENDMSDRSIGVYCDSALSRIPEQRRIVAELGAVQAEVQELKRLQTDTAAELDAFLPAILDRAFKGGLCA